MKATGRLLVISLSTALSFGVLGAVHAPEAEANTTVRTYLPDSPYELRRRNLQTGAPVTRSRLPSPQTLYQDPNLTRQSPSGLVTETPATLEEPLPLEVTPLYPRRAVSAPAQIDPISADEFASPAQPEPFEPIATDSFAQPDNGLPALPPPPAAFSALGDGTPVGGIEPVAPEPMDSFEPMAPKAPKQEARSLWDYLTSDSEDETIIYEQPRSTATAEPVGGILLPPPPPPPGFEGEPAPRVQTPVASVPPVPDSPFASAQPAPAQTRTVNLDISPTPSAQMPEPIRSPHNALSAESRNMISEIPEELTPAPQPVKRVKVSRIDPDIANILQAGQNSGMQTSSGNIGVKVKRPNFDVNYELEKAYQAVLGGNIEDAVGIYKEALSIAPRNKTGLFGLATTYHRIGSLDNARALYARLLEIDPDHREGLNNFLALVAEESPEEALPELQVLANKHPGFSPILAQLGLLYHQLGDNMQARQNMLSAVRISPENMTYRYNLAIMLDEQGAYAEAANVYRYLIGVSERGVTIPASPEALQARLTYILSQIS